MLEVAISVTLFTVVILSAMSMIESGGKLSRSTLEVAAVEEQSQGMLYRLERELANASIWTDGTSALGADLGAGATDAMILDSSLGFPPFGWVVLAPGTAGEEICRYEALDADEETLRTLTRAQGCTEASGFAGQATDVYWAGHAEWLGEIAPPLPGDRVTIEEGVQVAFRGSGAGFTFEKPVDPTGGNNVLNRDDLFWGADFGPAGPTETGKIAFYFEPKTAFVEADERHDLNEDGDFGDTFDVGQIRRISWDTTNPGVYEDVGLGPSAVVQERCNWGGDLNDDGFADPLFLWNPNTRMLHVRITMVGHSREMPITRTIESYTFLRNRPEGSGDI